MLTNCHGNDPPCAVRSRSTGNRLNRLLPVVLLLSLCPSVCFLLFLGYALSLFRLGSAGFPHCFVLSSCGSANLPMRSCGACSLEISSQEMLCILPYICSENYMIYYMIRKNERLVNFCSKFGRNKIRIGKWWEKL